MNIKIFALMTLLGLLVAGCSSDATSPMNPSPTSNITISPNDGATGVRLDADITLTFALPIDREVVERNVHLISERSMADSLCPISDSMGHGMMDTAMMDSVKMNHLMDRHAAHSRLSWTFDNRQYTLSPDSMMLPDMRYMVHIGREMVTMMEDRMGKMGEMGGHGGGTMSSHMMTHFTTTDTTGTDSGHDGHH